MAAAETAGTHRKAHRPARRCRRRAAHWASFMCAANAASVDSTRAAWSCRAAPRRADDSASGGAVAADAPMAALSSISTMSRSTPMPMSALAAVDAAEDDAWDDELVRSPRLGAASYQHCSSGATSSERHARSCGASASNRIHVATHMLARREVLSVRASGATSAGGLSALMFAAWTSAWKTRFTGRLTDLCRLRRAWHSVFTRSGCSPQPLSRDHSASQSARRALPRSSMVDGAETSPSPLPLPPPAAPDMLTFSSSSAAAAAAAAAAEARACLRRAAFELACHSNSGSTMNRCTMSKHLAWTEDSGSDDRGTTPASHSVCSGRCHGSAANRELSATTAALRTETLTSPQRATMSRRPVSPSVTDGRWSRTHTPKDKTRTANHTWEQATTQHKHRTEQREVKSKCGARARETDAPWQTRQSRLLPHLPACVWAPLPARSTQPPCPAS